MPQRLETFGSDRRLVLANGEAIRAPIYLGNWTRIRIGLQCCFSDLGVNATGTPRIAFGVCSGNQYGYGAGANTVHCVGLRSVGATWSRALSGSVPYYTISTTGYNVFTKVGNTITDTLIQSSTRAISASTSVRHPLFFELAKGSPYTAKSVHVSPSVSGAIQNNMTDAQFLALMELGNLDDAGTVLTGYTPQGPGNITVDETTNGTLDHIFVYWERTSFEFSFNIRHRKVS